jgi:hypothetical protein
MLMGLCPLTFCNDYNTFTFETLGIITLKTRHNIPEDLNHQRLCSENLKFCIINMVGRGDLQHTAKSKTYRGYIHITFSKFYLHHR